jgi:hypothetical protein
MRAMIIIRRASPGDDPIRSYGSLWLHRTATRLIGEGDAASASGCSQRSPPSVLQTQTPVPTSTSCARPVVPLRPFLLRRLLFAAHAILTGRTGTSWLQYSMFRLHDAIAPIIMTCSLPSRISRPSVARLQLSLASSWPGLDRESLRKPNCAAWKVSVHVC